MSTMTQAPDSAGRRLPALVAAVAVSLVLGIVGMHALTLHGLMGGTSHATMDMPIASTAHMSGHHDSPAADHAGGAAGAASTVAAGGESGLGLGLGHMMMLCVAMIALGAGTLLLTLLASRRRPRLWAQLPTAATALVKPCTSRRSTGPPPVWEFSIIRC